MVPIQKPAPRPPVAVIVPSTVAVPSVQKAELHSQHRQLLLQKLGLPDPDNDEFIYNVEAALALLEVVTDDEEDI